MIKIELLKNHPQAIQQLAKIWYDVLGQKWMPEISIAEIAKGYYDELNDVLPLAYIALDEGIPVGACSLKLNDGIRSDLSPWIADLVVDASYQKQGIGKQLMHATLEKAKDLGFEKVYLFTFDSNLSTYYQRIGCKEIGVDEFAGHAVTVMEYDLQDNFVYIQPYSGI